MNDPVEWNNASDAPFVLLGVEGLTQVSKLTGPDSPNRTDRYGVYGTDLGSMFTMGDRTYFVFGDTFGPRPPGKTGAGGENWRSNVIAFTTDTDPSDGIAFDGMIADDLGNAMELLPSPKIKNVEITKIPTHGFSVGNSMYLHYMSVNRWGESGDWTANHSRLAKSVDEGRSWTFLDHIEWPGDSNFIQVSPFKIKINDRLTEIYFWSIPAGRHGGVQLMKVDETMVERSDSYLYYTGTDENGRPIWSGDMNKARTIVEDQVGELSVIWNPYLQRWIMTYLSGTGPVVIREGITPWGPWGDRIVIATQEAYPGLYSPYMHPLYMENGGETIYFTLSRWGPYSVYWMKMTLLKRE